MYQPEKPLFYRSGKKIRNNFFFSIERQPIVFLQQICYCSEMCFDFKIHENKHFPRSVGYRLWTPKKMSENVRIIKINASEALWLWMCARQRFDFCHFFIFHVLFLSIERGWQFDRVAWLQFWWSNILFFAEQLIQNYAFQSTFCRDHLWYQRKKKQSMKLFGTWSTGFIIWHNLNNFSLFQRIFNRRCQAYLVKFFQNVQ